jgi:hypothetical protein
MLRSIQRPLDVLDTGLPADLLWSDPAEDVDNWEFNHERGVSFRFGKKQIDEFLNRFGFELVGSSYVGDSSPYGCSRWLPIL